jgi:hypothetical protein
MKLFLMLLLLSTASILKAQSSPGEQLAGKIAQKLKDSLSLTTTQQEGVYAANMRLHNLKMTLRQQHLSADALRVQFQKVENTRDSLYQRVLTANQFQQYRQKKKNLVNNN